MRSQGYTSVFTLGKRDFEAAVADYPGFVERLKQGAKSVLQQDRERWEEGRRSRTVSGTYRVMNKVIVGVWVAGVCPSLSGSLLSPSLACMLTCQVSLFQRESPSFWPCLPFWSEISLFLTK